MSRRSLTRKLLLHNVFWTRSRMAGASWTWAKTMQKRGSQPSLAHIMQEFVRSWHREIIGFVLATLTGLIALAGPVSGEARGLALGMAATVIQAVRHMGELPMRDVGPEFGGCGPKLSR